MTRTTIFVTLAAATALSALIGAAPATAPSTAPRQPVLPEFQADPSARAFGDKLYIYASHDLAGNRSWDNMLDFHAFVSDDARTFTDLGQIFSVADLTWAKKQLWAPDCIERDGKYYLYFAAEAQIGVAVGDSPKGPFKDALGKPLLAKKTAGLFTIDPCAFIDDDGQAYLYFANAPAKVGLVKLNRDMISIDGPVQVIPMPHYHEGVWVHKRAGVYYCSYPSTQGQKTPSLLEYSTASSPTGPFESRGIILDNRSRNVHGSIVHFKDNDYVVYHIQGPSPYERRTYIDPITYNADGSIQPIGVVEGIK
jgi:arabinoxylan arabinofuranohydrolase